MGRPASFWLKLFKLADQEDVSKACRRMRVSRDSYYRMRKQYRRRGRAGLEPTSRRGPLKKPRLAPGIEEAVLELARNEPEMGKERAAVELAKRSRVYVSGTGVRGVWLRHKLTTRQDRREFSRRMGMTAEGVRLAAEKAAAVAKEEATRRAIWSTSRETGYYRPPKHSAPATIRNASGKVIRVEPGRESR